MAGGRPQAGLGDGGAPCEAGALIPEPVSDRPARAGEPVRAEIVALLLAERERLSVGSVKGRVGELRSLLSSGLR